MLNERPHFSDVFLLGVEHFFGEHSHAGVLSVIIAKPPHQLVYAHGAALYHHFRDVGSRRVALQVAPCGYSRHGFDDRAYVLCLLAPACQHFVSRAVKFAVTRELVAEHAVYCHAVLHPADIRDTLTAHFGVLQNAVEHFNIVQNNHLCCDYVQKKWKYTGNAKNAERLLCVLYKAVN